MERLSKKDYYLSIAVAVSARSTCLRRHYGAVIVKDDEIIATGYNGSPRGELNCTDRGYCYRLDKGIPHGEQYEKCQAVHAEQNAIISASRADMKDSTMYLYGSNITNGIEYIMKNAEPCEICRKLIKNAGIKEVITYE